MMEKHQKHISIIIDTIEQQKDQSNLQDRSERTSHVRHQLTKTVQLRKLHLP